VLDGNEKRTYKNKQKTTQEIAMFDFVKDLMAFVALGAFSVAAVTWMDVLTRLV
jgi:hypothetical protein